MTFAEFLEHFEQRAKIDGRAAYFLARAYVSWYRPAEENNCNLYEFNQLDPEDRDLLFTMLQIREVFDFRDNDLFELEQRLIEHWKIGESEEKTRRVELQTGEDDLDPDDS